MQGTTLSITPIDLLIYAGLPVALLIILAALAHAHPRMEGHPNRTRSEPRPPLVMLQPTHTLPLTPENRHLALRDNIIGIDVKRAAVIWQQERGSGVYVTNIYAGEGPLTPDALVARHNDPAIQPLHSFHFYTGTDRRAFAEAGKRIAVLTRHATHVAPHAPDDPDATQATVT